MQVVEIYKEWVKLLEHLPGSWQGERLSLGDQNDIALVNSNNIKCDRELFCTPHMKRLHRIEKVVKTFNPSSPLMLVRLMIMLDNLQELKTMQSSNFDNY